MDDNGSGAGRGDYPYPWGGDLGYSQQRPDLRHQISSISAVSSTDSYGSGHRDSMVSLPSPISDGPSRSQSSESFDTRSIRNPSIPSGIMSPTESVRGSSYSSKGPLPDTLRAGTPTQSYSSKGPLPALPDTLRAGTPTPSPSTSRGFSNPFRSPPQAYQPVFNEDNTPKNSGSRSGSKKYTRRRSSLMQSSSIPEGEEVGMGLLGSAMPMGTYGKQHKTAYSTVQEEDPDGATILSPMPFDVSTFLGPPQNEQQEREANKREAAGVLTGGLGMGLKPEETITSSALFSSTPQTPGPPPSPLNRRLSMLRSPTFRQPGSASPRLARAGTVKEIRELGQAEANKRGKIIEVVVEEEGDPNATPFDVSSFAGGSATSLGDFVNGPGTHRKSTFAPTVEIFYPQANWKPFSMRWPYLTALVTISLMLAAAQEYVLHRGKLYTFKSAADLTTWQYFTFKYLPTLIAVTFGVLWQVTDFEVKRLEAFYQLSRKEGALAAESINVDYITFFNFLRPARALKYKHYAVAVSSLATLVAVSLVPTLQVATLELHPSRKEREDNPNADKYIQVNGIHSRLLSSVLLLVAVMGCILIYQLQRRPSGLVADVKGIAGIAAMANRSHILMDFKNMDTATPELIHQTLKSHRYSLRNSSLVPEDKVPLTQEEKDKYDQQTRHENPHPLMLRLVAGIPFIIGMMLFALIVPVILFTTGANVITEKVPWLLTTFAVGIKLGWGTLETDVRMIEPFYILSRRHASPKVLTLDYTAMAFGWMPIRAFANGHFLVGLVGLGSVLAEVLTVCATSFANVSGHDFISPEPPPPPQRRADNDSNINAGEETFLSFWLSFSLALFIITFLCFVSMLVYIRRRHPFLPRQPNTIASILAFIHQSKMLYDFVGTEKMNNDEMVAKLATVGKTYGLGWFMGRDGEMHCGVDEEELVSGYKHGDDARKARVSFNTDWERY